MAKKQRKSILAKYTRTLFSNTAKKSAHPCRQHIHISSLIDILSRKDHHHVLLQGSSSNTYNMAFLEGLAQHIAENPTIKILHNAYFFHLDIVKLAASPDNLEHLEQDFYALHEEIRTSKKSVILAVSNVDLALEETATSALKIAGSFLKTILTDAQWRIIAIQNDTSASTLTRSFFTPFKLNEPSYNEALSILKTFHRELEDFHQVVIPQETFSYAVTLASRYFGSQSLLDNALRILDSAAARTSNGMLSNNTLASVVSSWTNIPLALVQRDHFKAFELAYPIQQHIFGQETAINQISLAAQYAYVKPSQNQAPLCSFLFAGPHHVGKSATAYALAEQLFGSKNYVLQLNLNNTQQAKSLADIKITPTQEQNQQTSLLEAIQQMPYAVILAENVNESDSNILSLLNPILTLGYAFDEQGNKYDFRQAILVITTTLGAEKIISLTQPQPADLMQLVLNEKQSNQNSQHYYSLPELIEEISPELETSFNSSSLSQLNIIPFAPLDPTALDKIIRTKTATFIAQIEQQFNIELSCTSEVIQFLVQETLWRGKNTKSVDKALEQHLYLTVTHTILSRDDEDESSSKHLVVQLNDSGQFLRCEFAGENETVLYQS